MRRVNGIAIEDFMPIVALETGLAVPEAEPLYRKVNCNGFLPNDFIVDDSLVLYLPLYLLKGTKFKSVDRYAHTCTVTGALWRPTHRFFDGLDNRIITGATVPFMTTGAYTAQIWLQGSAATDPMTFLTLGVGSGALLDILTLRNMYPRFANWAGAWSSVNSQLTQDKWYCLTYLRSNTANWIQIYIDDLLDTDEAYVTENTSSTSSVTLGRAEFTPNPSQYFEGIIGEAWIYKRLLSAAEAIHNCNVTSWRYR